jgi:hypothetical protein
MSTREFRANFLHHWQKSMKNVAYVSVFVASFEKRGVNT